MPHLFSFAGNDDGSEVQELGHGLAVGDKDKPSRRPSLLRKPLDRLRRQLHSPRRQDNAHSNANAIPTTAPPELASLPEYFPPRRRPSLPDNLPAAGGARRAIPSLPRPQTFRRQESERREKLLQVEPSPNERRTLSADRRRSRGLSATRMVPRSPSPDLTAALATSAPDISQSTGSDPTPSESQKALEIPSGANNPQAPSRNDLPPLDIPPDIEPFEFEEDYNISECDQTPSKSPLEQEFESRWILNLSMHFRDKSNREKFFVTFADKPTQWRRVTVSLDYREAPPDSLEADLSTLHFQRDKSLRIYEAIRDSLPDIQYYDTVTNLKLETDPRDGQLHVHVREDANEIVQFPRLPLFDHINCPRIAEGSLEFVGHLSGFVYKVLLDAGKERRVVIKKEIPGPDTVDEFLYEVNALDALIGCENVTQLEGLVTDDRGEVVKGLLISYAENGALVDILYDLKGTRELPWSRREKWARQIVNGLAEIHEAGFVQGDFTLSNIVIDGKDDAQIIDINRRGCPVGWEPPELNRLIDSGQRIGMCIGVKTDLFQLGMVLWALAEETDEPERLERPLRDVSTGIPEYYRQIVRICLSEMPQGRLGAKQLLGRFPEHPKSLSRQPSPYQRRRLLDASDHSESTHRSAKEYIDPQLAVTIDEVRRGHASGAQEQRDLVTYVNPDSDPASSIYRFESSGSWVVGRERSRGRSPVSRSKRRSSPYGQTISSATSVSAGTTSPKWTGERHDGQSPSGVVMDKRLAAVRAEARNQDPASLMHTDSGFDEAMEDDLEISVSQLTDRSQFVGERRKKTYVSDEDEDDSDVDEMPPPTPASWHTANEKRNGSNATLMDDRDVRPAVGGRDESTM